MGFLAGFRDGFTDLIVGIGVSILTFFGVPVAAGPTCTVDLSADQLAWSVTEAADVTIAALTDSPPVPGASQDIPNAHPFSGTLDELFSRKPQVILDELRNNGVPNASFDPSSNGLIDGFFPNATVANRICEVYFPGSKNDGYSTRSYKTPKNNTILILEGGVWRQERASNFPRKGRHIERSASFICERDASIPPMSGTHDFTPSLPVGTHTYRLIAQGPSGTNTCEASVTVPPAGEDDDAPGAGAGAGSGVGGSGSGSGSGSGVGPLPQCSDGIDNDNDGRADYPEDPKCQSAGDNNEFAIPNPPAVLALFPAQSLVRSGETATLSWNIKNVQTDSCTLSGTNGDSWVLSDDDINGSRTSSPLSVETVFTLSCADLDDNPVSTATTIKIAPSFQEL